METLAFAAAALFVLGVPAFSSVAWVRSSDPTADSVDLAGAAFGGVGVAALSIWIVALFAGLSVWSAMVAVTAGSLALAAPAFVRARRNRAVAGSATGIEVPSGQQDGRVVPEAVVIAEERLAARESPPPNPHFGALMLAGALFAVLAYIPFFAYGWQRPDGVHRMAMTDWYKHLVTTGALGASDAFPPHNPFLQPSEPAPYYYGFHLLSASIARVGAVIAGPEAIGELVFPALLLLTLATAAATPVVAYAAARTIASGRGRGLGDTSRVPLFAALGATFLAGFDLIPLLLNALVDTVRGWPLPGGLAGLRAVIPSTHLDFWIHHNERQLNAPFLTTVWAPQHMVAVLLALLVIQRVIQRHRLADRGTGDNMAGAPWLLPALLLGAIPSLSAYVAVGFALGVTLAILAESLYERCQPWRAVSFGMWVMPALGGAVLAIPVGMVLGSGLGPGFEVTVSAAGNWSNGAVFTSLFGDHMLTRIADTPAVYLIEFGILGVLAVIEIRRRAARRRLERHQRHVIAVAIAVLVFVALVRPPVGGPNNLYARPLVLVWFLISPFAAMNLARVSGAVVRVGGIAGGDHAAISRARRVGRLGGLRWTLAGLSLCGLATGYALLGVVLEGTLFWATPPEAVDAARWINRNLPAGAVVAVLPDDLSESQAGYWLRRRLALGDQRHAELFGAAPGEFEQASALIQEAVAAGDSDALRDTRADHAMVRSSSAAVRAGVARGCFESVYDNGSWTVLRALQCGP